ncbi:MAG: hypothetical protein IPL43_03800 [Micropruina sp.]|nr:hypothetical protein [Micropruina sp.]
MFHKLTSTEQADLDLANDLLSTGLDMISDDVVSVYEKVLPESTYTILLQEVVPRLVEPGSDGDYFTHEQVRTWGVDPVLGAPEDPGTEYYRTFECPVGLDGHLYEIVVPMVPPSWNSTDRVAQYEAAGNHGATAVGYCLLDTLQPAIDESEDYYQHSVLTHFLLDGHNKMEAAARQGTPIRLLSFLDERISISSMAEVQTVIQSLSRPQQARVRPH